MFFLVLSVKPCSDGTNTDDLVKEEISATHNHQEDKDDSCPITCVCYCCGTSIAYETPPTFVIKAFTRISQLNSTDYKSIYRFKFLSNIWQPPQIIS